MSNLAKRSGWLFVHSTKVKRNGWTLWITAHRVNWVPFYEGTGLVVFRRFTDAPTPEDDYE